MKKNKEEKTKNIEPNKEQKIESVESAKEKVKKTETSNDKENKKSKVSWRTLAVIAFLLIFILCTLVSIRVKYLNVRQLRLYFFRYMETLLAVMFMRSIYYHLQPPHHSILQSTGVLLPP